MVDQKHQPKWHVSEKRCSSAAAVRRELTEAGRISCYTLRARRCYGVSLRTQARVGRHLVDFICHAAKLIVEVDGSQHFEPKTIVRDTARDACLTAQGCSVVRFNNLDVMKNKASLLQQIGSELPCLTLPRRGPGRAGREEAP